jgi:MFS family permease
LPPVVRRLVVSSAVSALGTGLVLPLTLIYLHRVRHIPLTTTGLLLAIPGVVGLVAVPLAGTLMDRVGARRVLAVCMLTVAGAQFALAFVPNAAWVAPVLLVQGAAMGPTFSAFNTLLASLTVGGMQERAFAVNFTVLNAGIGVGGLIGSGVVDVHLRVSFQLMFLGNAVATAAAAALVLSISAPIRPRPQAPRRLTKARWAIGRFSRIRCCDGW